MSDEGIRLGEQTRLSVSSTSTHKQQPAAEGVSAGGAGEGAEGQPIGTRHPRASKAMGVAAVLASLALVIAAGAAVMISAGFAMNARYVSAAGGEQGFVVDTWNDTVVMVDGAAASVVPLDLNDSKTVPGGLLWGEFEDVEFTTELHYTNGRLRYEFATEELNEPIRRAMSRGKEIRFLLTSYEGVPLVAIDENFADAVRLIDNSTENEEPVGVSFTGAVEADQGTWRAIAGVRTQFR